MIAWSDVTNIAPELSTVATGTQNAIIEDVYAELDPNNVSPNSSGRLDILAKYLCAHLATIAARGGNGQGGAVTTDKAGDLSRSYATPMFAVSEAGYTSTPYGLEFLRKRKAFMLPRILVT